MNRFRIALGFLCLALTLLVVIPAQAFPPSGYDNISTTASINIYDPVDSSLLVETITLIGDAVIWRGNEYDPGDGRMTVDTRLDTLLLRGFSLNAGDSIFATLNRSKPAATGWIKQINPGTDFPAESFFDVYYEITYGSAPNPPSESGGAQGKLQYDLQSGLGQVMLAVGQVSTGLEAPVKAPYTGPANKEDGNAARQGGEDVTNPTVIPALPYTDVGVTTGYADDYDEACPSTSTSPDVVYSFTPTVDTFMIIDLCGPETDYDTKVFVYENNVNTLVACNDDACSNAQTPYASKIECFPVTGGSSYYIIVDGWGGAFGMYELQVDYCSGLPCDVTCPAGASFEDEPCGTDANGGCNSAIPTFSPIQCGETVCGTAWADTSTRDTDWYELILTQTMTVDFTVVCEFPGLIGLVEMGTPGSGDCADMTGALNPYSFKNACDTISISMSLGVGTHWLFVAPSVFTGYPCVDGPWDYVATVTCNPQITWINPDSVHMIDTIYQIPPLGRVYKDPRKTPVINPAGDTVGWLWHEHIVDPPPGGVDTIPTTGWMDVWQGPNPPGPTQPPDEVIEVNGEAIISRGDPTPLPEGGHSIQTEIISMDLTGESQLFGPTILSLPQPAAGQTNSTGGEFWPAESFFNVYYQITFPQLGQVIEPLEPPQMTTEVPVNSFPPEDINLIDPNPHPVHDVQNPGIIVGWVRPIHWLPPRQDSSGACCDLSNGSCRITTAADCNPVHEQYQGDGTTCAGVQCNVPPPDHDCFQSVGQGTITLDPADDQCANGISLSLSSLLSPSTVIQTDPPPYHDGQIIQTEMIQMELTTVDPNLGTVIVRERADRTSTGQILNTVTDGQGNFVQGDSEFDLFLEVELPDLGLLLNTGASTLRMEATIYSLPPDSAYFPPPAQPPLPLYDALTGTLMGWLCHAEHTPGLQIPCDEPRGACCDTASGDCNITPASQCVGGPLVYQGDNTSCVPNPCVDTCTTGWTPGLDTILFSTFSIDVYNPTDSNDFWGTMVAYGTTMIVQRGAPYEVSPGIWRQDTQILQLTGAGSSAIFGPFTVGLDPNNPSLGFIEMCDSCDDNWARSEFTVNYVITTTLGPPLSTLTGSSTMELPCSDGWDPTTPPHGHQYVDPRKVPIYDASGQIIGYTMKRHRVDSLPPCTHWTPGLDTIIFSTFEIEYFAPGDTINPADTLVAYGANMVVQRGAPFEETPNIWRMNTTVLEFSGSGWSTVLGAFQIDLDPSATSGGFIRQCDSCDDGWAESHLSIVYVITTNLPPPMDTIQSDTAQMHLPCDQNWDPGDPFTPAGSYVDPRKVPIYDAAGNIIGYIWKRHNVGTPPGNVGACCVGSVCVITSAADCQLAGGVYQGDGTSCTPDPCDNPIPGACCLPTGECQELLQVECEQLGGQYKGDGVPCSPTICESCCNHDGIRGDVNLDFSLDVSDLTYIVDYLFRGGPPPPCDVEADPNGSGGTDVSDLGYIVDYLFNGGPAPLPCILGK